MLSIEQIVPRLTWKLRGEVLYPEQSIHSMGLPEDEDGMHFGAFMENKIVGVVSLFKTDSEFQFRKLAIEPSWQYKRVGSSLLEFVTAFARINGGKRLWCNARISAVDFYLKAGFRSTGNSFIKNEITYQIVEKSLEEA